MLSRFCAHLCNIHLVAPAPNIDSISDSSELEDTKGGMIIHSILLRELTGPRVVLDDPASSQFVLYD